MRHWQYSITLWGMVKVLHTPTKKEKKNVVCFAGQGSPGARRLPGRSATTYTHEKKENR